MAAINPEELIEAVRKNPALYDQTREYYRNYDFKDMVWKKVAGDLNVEGQEEECKKKWTGIRDSLRRALQKRKRKSGQAATSTNKYKYETILEFLIPHLVERKGFSNVPDEGTDDDAPGTGYESQQRNSTQETQLPQVVSDGDESEETTEPSQFPLAITNRVSAYKRHSYAGRKRKLRNSEVKSQKSKSTRRSQNSEHHSVDAFLVGIAISLKSLDPVRLLAAKGKIFNVVQEYELQQIRANGQQGTSSAQTSRVSTPAHITSEEEGSYADVYGPPHLSNYIAPILEAPTMSTDEDTNLSFSEF